MSPLVVLTVLQPPGLALPEGTLCQLPLSSAHFPFCSSVCHWSRPVPPGLSPSSDFPLCLYYYHLKLLHIHTILSKCPSLHFFCDLVFSSHLTT